MGINQGGIIRYLLLFILTVSIMLLGACGCECPTVYMEDADCDGVTDSIDIKCPSTPKGTIVDEIGCPKKLDNVTVYFDVSHGMRGYMFNGGFKANVIASFVTAIDNMKGKPNGIVSTDYVLYGLNPLPSFSSPIELTSNIDYMKFSGTESLLDKMLDSVTQTIKPGYVAIVVTDGMLSHNNVEISNNREINKTYLPTLQTRISSRIKDNVFNKGFGCYVLASKAEFECNAAQNVWYFDYKNTKHPVGLVGSAKLPDRPYYLFLFGENSDLNFFIEKVIKASDDYTFEESLIFNANMESTFVEVDNSMTKGNIIPGEWQSYADIAPCPTSFYKNKICIRNTTKSVAFAILLDMYQFVPANAQKLANSFSVTGADKITPYTKEDFIKTFDPINKNKYQTATHVLLAEFTVPPPSNKEVEVSFHNTEWYQEWSIDDDSALDSIRGKTFGLSSLVKGIKSAAPKNGNKNIENLIVKLKILSCN
ncbi:MAG TPA: hypothetical protein PK239_14155 [Chitinophagales bacterium]|nr:hypothetical protein [Chitinophagales bacterium]